MKQIQFLVNHGLDVNEKDTDGSTILHWIAHPLQQYHINKDMIWYLLNNGVDVEASDLAGNTALHTVLESQATSAAALVDLSLRAGHDINLKGSHGCTPLILASMRNDPEIVKQLLSKDAKVDLQDEKGRSALMIACQKGFEEIARVLLSYNADSTLKNCDGDTATDLVPRPCTRSLGRMLMRHWVREGVIISREEYIQRFIELHQCKQMLLLVSRGVMMGSDFGSQRESRATKSGLLISCVNSNEFVEWWWGGSAKISSTMLTYFD